MTDHELPVDANEEKGCPEPPSTPSACEFATIGHRGRAFAAKHTSVCDHPLCSAHLIPGTLIRSDGAGGYECASHGSEGDPAPATAPAALREQIAAAIWERQNPGHSYAECDHPWMADAEEDADAVLRVPAIAEALATVARVAALADEYPAGIDTALVHEALDQSPINPPKRDQELQQLQAQVARVRKAVADMHGTDGARHWARWLDSVLNAAADPHQPASDR